MQNTKPELTVIIPVLNEEKYIRKLLENILEQDYDLEKCEVLFVDGGSSDGTCQVLHTFCEAKNSRNLSVRVLANPRRTVQHAMNLGIDAAAGDYIFRMDAHSFYPKRYFSTLMETLKARPEVGNVGGTIRIVGDGTLGRAYACVMSTLFGAGKSDFRFATEEKTVSSVPFGAFRKKELVEIGKFHEHLERNEDFELNHRYIRKGYQVLLKPELVISYHCRNTLRGIVRHEYIDGVWNSRSLLYCPYSFSVSHFIPLLFVLSLLVVIPCMIAAVPVLSVLGWIEVCLYGGLDVLFAVRNMRNGFLVGLLSAPLYPVHHISYGIGELVGLLEGKHEK